jgi:NAD(P)H-dependent FMN reductase
MSDILRSKPPNRVSLWIKTVKNRPILSDWQRYSIGIKLGTIYIHICCITNSRVKKGENRMVTIISGSNREDNNTRKIASEYQRILKEKGVGSSLLSLDAARVFERDEAFRKIENEYLAPADRFIIVLPEYNGSYPGILKLMIDNSDINRSWKNKKVLLTGVSTGRAGNLRGMEHLTGSLMHMKMHVHPNRLPISQVDKLLDEEDHIKDPGTLKAVDTQLEEFLAF